MRAMVPLLAASALLVLAACGDDDAIGEPDRVGVAAELAAPDDRFAVEASPVEAATGGVVAHEVRVTWDGEESIVLDDARFTHRVDDGEGTLVTAGRGCGVQWDEDRDDVLQPCTADLQIIELAPGETHAYPVTVHPEVGPLRLRAGTYVVEEQIAWWPAGDDPIGAYGGEPEGTITVRLTYEVQ